MNKDRLQLFAEKLSEISNEFAADIPQADSAVETILYGLAEIVEEDSKANAENAMVKSLLDTVVEQLKGAAFNYYASWK